MTNKKIFSKTIITILLAVILAGSVLIFIPKETKAWDNSNNVIWDGRNWIAVKNGKFAQWYTGIAENKYGWWRIEKGVVNFKYTGLASCEYGWFYIRNGAIDWRFTGFVFHNNKWWFVRNGAIDWGYYGLAQGGDGKWYFVNGGYVDWYVTGLAYYNGGWFYVDHGIVNWNADTLCKNQWGWWKVTNGKVDFGFNGLYQYYGTWYYLRNGAIDWGYYGLAKGWQGNWYFVNGGYIDWHVTGTAYHNGRPWSVVNGKVTGMKSFLKETGYRSLRDCFGRTRTQFVDFMFNREARYNYNYYLNTRYGISWAERNSFYPNGARRSDGYAGMNCAGFVKVAIQDAGGNLSRVYNYCRYHGEDAPWGLAGASVWFKFLSGEGIKCRTYSSKWDLLSDGWAQRGDIIYCKPTNGGDTHMGIYWGGYAGEDSFWHSSAGRGNKISPLQAPSKCIWYVFKWE